MKTKEQDIKDIWKIVLAQLEIKLSENPVVFKTYIKETKLQSIDGKISIVGVSNSYVLETIKNKYNDLIEKTLAFVSGVDGLKIKFVLDQNEEIKISDQLENSPLLSLEKGIPSSINDVIRNSGLNTKYRMNSYIVGNSNSFAYSAVMAVIEKPGEVYNPLFIHGKSGLGKTHLIQGAAIAILERDPKKKVYYSTSENFLNDFVAGIKRKENEKMRQKYRNLDVLIIDDLQLIAKWVQTKDEFFNTFNDLYNAGKQIILIADRNPREIQNIESRLRSRMEGGMVAEILPPDFETRLAILQRKLDTSGFNLKPNVLEFIAREVNDNVRELEGALNKIGLFNNTKPNGDLTLEEIATILNKDARSKREQVKIPRVLKEVSKNFGVSVKDLKGPRRTSDLALARQVAMYILRVEFKYKLEEVAKHLNRQDHTTVIHAIDKVESKMRIQSDFNHQIASLIRTINDSSVILEDF